eukprot:TRINITY_DN3295_c0_g4_i3.p1 TRINITY_DN3295_c0_g4~~TRINITY_DN3295_c0_g4_i3.p1  ORF type:complete len:191 (-),score=77.34 TRINITY_DN3295_c0_g4_i3:47-619(-)
MKSIKCVAVGDGGSGKTCLLMTFALNEFPNEYIPTIFDNYVVNLIVQGETINLELFDTFGGVDYSRIRALNYPQTDVFLLCFSIQAPHSFENVQSFWFPEIAHYCPKSNFLFVGTKIDLRNDQQQTLEIFKQSNQTLISYEEGFALANDFNTKYSECSSLKNEGVKQVFNQVIEIALFSQNRYKTYCLIC